MANAKLKLRDSKPKPRSKEENLHGNAPDSCKTALLLVDVINDLNFPNGEKLQKPFERMSIALEKLLKKSRDHNVPILYVNDNFGKWRSDFKTQIKNCLSSKSRTAKALQGLLPKASDYYILKAKHSAFYASPLEILLRALGTETLVIAGLTAESCVLFTATDAYLRDYRVVIAEDCVASFSADKKRSALRLMKESLKARVVKASSIKYSS